MTARWTKVDAAHPAEGTREEWRLDVDGRTHAAARMWDGGNGWEYETYDNAGRISGLGWSFDFIECQQTAEMTAMYAGVSA